MMSFLVVVEVMNEREGPVQQKVLNGPAEHPAKEEAGVRK